MKNIVMFGECKVLFCLLSVFKTFELKKMVKLDMVNLEKSKTRIITDKIYAIYNGNIISLGR